jgi:RNA polymerase sigma-70 factor (ECF subfamily)
MLRVLERRLIRRTLAGDRDAAEALIRAYQGSLFAYITRVSGRRDVAEDVVQEAFVRALTNLEQYDPKWRFTTWLFAIARRIYLNQLEKKQPWSGEDGTQIAGSSSPAVELSWKESHGLVRSRLERALLQLHEVQREVVVLFHQHDWPIGLIARHLEIPEGTVKSHLFRGRTRLRELLSSEEGLGELRMVLREARA